MTEDNQRRQRLLKKTLRKRTVVRRGLCLQTILDGGEELTRATASEGFGVDCFICSRRKLSRIMEEKRHSGGGQQLLKKWKKTLDEQHPWRKNKNHGVTLEEERAILDEEEGWTTASDHLEADFFFFCRSKPLKEVDF